MSAHPTASGLLAAARRIGPALLAVAPVAALTAVLVYSWRGGDFAVDFHQELYVQARALLETGVAFDPPDVVIDGSNRIFPPLATMAATPLALLPATGADIAMTALLLLSAAATLWVLEVRDWRVYAVAALWPAFLSGVQTANVTLFVSLLAALAWRYRNRRLAPGVLVGLAVGLKLFPWPLALWLLATRRYAAAAMSVLVGCASLLLVLPFGSPLDYLRLVRRLGAEMDEHGYTMYALLGPGSAARVAALVVAVAALALVVLARRDDRRCFTLAILACLVCTPIVWLHYLQLLVVPLAITRPRLSPLWFVPLALLVPVSYADRWQIALALGVVVAVVAALVRPAENVASTGQAHRRPLSVEPGLR